MATNFQDKAKDCSDHAQLRKLRADKEAEPTTGFGRNAISVFILFHLIVITCWAIPTDIPPIRIVKNIVRPYMLWTGLFQMWNMFAPNPTPVNSYVKAIVISRGRHLKVWAFPRMEELNFWQRYRQERYRKFTEVLPDPASEPLWPDVASHIARLFSSNEDPPDRVMLIRLSAPINPAAGESAEPNPEPTVFYDDYVELGDLK